VTLKPQPKVMPGKPHEEACAAHLAALQRDYGEVPQEQKMLKGHLLRVIYHQVY